MTTKQMTLYPFGFEPLTTPTSKISERRVVERLTGTTALTIYPPQESSELSVDEMFAQLESADPRAAAATEAGTKWVVQTFLADAPPSLAKLRMQAGLTQRALAKRLDVSQPQVSKWEKGEMPNMQFRTMRSLATALSVELPYLVTVLAAAEAEKGRPE